MIAQYPGQALLVGFLLLLLVPLGLPLVLAVGYLTAIAMTMGTCGGAGDHGWIAWLTGRYHAGAYAPLAFLPDGWTFVGPARWQATGRRIRSRQHGQAPECEGRTGLAGAITMCLVQGTANVWPNELATEFAWTVNCVIATTNSTGIRLIGKR